MTLRTHKPVKDDYPRPWERRPVDRVRWRRHRTRLMAELPPGTRPPEWWAHDEGLEPPQGQTAEMLALWNMGELEDSERQECIRVWRLLFETIHDDGTARWSDGERWLTGAAACQAAYKFHNIPEELIAAWTGKAEKIAVIDAAIRNRARRSGC